MMRFSYRNKAEKLIHYLLCIQLYQNINNKKHIKINPSKTQQKKEAKFLHYRRKETARSDLRRRSGASKRGKWWVLVQESNGRLWRFWEEKNKKRTNSSLSKKEAFSLSKKGWDKTHKKTRRKGSGPARRRWAPPPHPREGGWRAGANWEQTFEED